jgi:hypothetical protein
VRRGARARQIDPKWLPQQEICRAPGATHGKLTILCCARGHETHDNGTGAPGAWTILCRAPRHMTHGRGHGQPCTWTILCRAPSHVAHGKEYHRFRACSAEHGRESVTPSPRGRPSTPFCCRASLIPHGKELCRVLPSLKHTTKVFAG